ncbi:MAG: glycosyltransferase family 9 protein [Spartobacteria bacterium]|nr:glycosyltransferase family 9 protein [Spartobacteria bacterium]
MKKRWLFIEPGRIGDWVLANAVVHRFLETHGGTIDWAVRSELRPLLDCGVPYENVIEIPSRMTALKAAGLTVACLRRRTRYDGCCVLSPGKSGRLVSRCMRAKGKFGYTAKAYGNGDSVDGKDIVYRPDRDHLLFRALQTCFPQATPATYNELVQDGRNRPTLQVLPADRQAIEDVLDGWGIAGTFVAMNIGSRSTFRRWPMDHWKRLIAMLLDRETPVVIAGSPAEYEEGLHVQRAIGRDHLYVMAPCALNRYAALLSMGRVVVCHDSGPMHLAPAVGTRTVAIFGPSDPALTAPVCDVEKLAVVRCAPPLPCQPCITPMNSHLEFDHCADTQKCMRALSPQTVFHAVDSFLKA